jgi:CTP:molybdopterin cytidylyltransferase MocA
MTTLRSPSLTAVVLVLEDTAELAATHARYAKALEPAAERVDFVYVVDGQLPQALSALRELRRKALAVEVLCFPTRMGEAAALSVGLQAATGEVVMTLAAEPRVEDADLLRLVAALDGADLVVGRRSHVMEESRGRGRKLDHLVDRLFGTGLKDIRSTTRAMRADVARELTLYGNQFNFLPLLAQAQGFRVVEVDIRCRRPATAAKGLLPFDPSLILDVIAVFFLLRFLRKPFRFFGGFGFAVLVLGLLLTAWLVGARLFFDVPLGERPALILSTLLIVLGIQIISVGLIGEIISFTYAKDVKDYRVERLVEPEQARARERAVL